MAGRLSGLGATRSFGSENGGKKSHAQGPYVILQKSRVKKKRRQQDLERTTGRRVSERGNRLFWQAKCLHSSGVLE